MAKKQYKYNKNSVIRGALRRAFARSPIVQEIINESRREVPRYKKDGTRHKKNLVERQCQVCNGWVSSSKMAVDHIVPVISIDDGFQDWNEFINRLWCDKSNLQRICSICHDIKTHKERISRLTIKYTAELDIIESQIYEAIKYCTKEQLSLYKKGWIQELSKYLTKKKTKGLDSVVQRASDLKQLIKNL